MKDYEAKQTFEQIVAQIAQRLRKALAVNSEEHDDDDPDVARTDQSTGRRDPTGRD
jgi:hypothetical protein